MKLLIGGAPSKFFHLKEFSDSLEKIGVECLLVSDVEVYDGFPSRNIRNWFQTRKKFNQLLQDFRPDAIFIDRQRHFALAATESKIHSFMLLRGDYWNEVKWAKESIYRLPHKRFALSQWDRIACKCFENATMVLPICKYLQNIVNQHYPLKSTEVLYGGIDKSRWYQVPGMELKHPCVGLLQGAWIWGKTKEMLTLVNVIKALPKVMFYWAGDGPYRDKILSALSKYENFKWLGSLSYPDKVREYLSSIDVYALMSGIDMSPLTLQEAQLMKKPVIATSVGGIPELMKENESGFLVKESDSTTWIEKIELLINDEHRSKQMGEVGRKFVEDNFSCDKIARDFVKITKSYLNESF